MKTEIREGVYEKQKCIIAENENIKMLLLPELGNKIVSFISKETKHEYIYKSERAYRRSHYADSYQEYDIGGFDDCFPTVGECYYPKEPWQGILVPEHGELWSSALWHCEIFPDSIYLWTYGVRFPYKFEKWISFSFQSTVSIKYKLTSLCNQDLYFIWSSHPLLNISEGTRIILPREVDMIRVSYSARNRLGNLGATHSWPITTDRYGKKCDLSKIPPPNPQFADKIFTTKLKKESWCCLHNQNIGEALLFSFPVEKVPYIGVWVNQGEWMGSYTAALEGCTGAPDRLDIAVEWGDVAILPAETTYEWYMNITLDKMSNLNIV